MVVVDVLASELGLNLDADILNGVENGIQLRPNWSVVELLRVGLV